VNTESSKESSIGSHPSIGTRLERVCDGFEAAWRTSLQNGGDGPLIERHIEGIAPEERWAFLRELILTDQQYRELGGQVVDTREYEERFPEFAEFIPPLFRKTPSLTRIRDYRLLEVIGQGGMGTVYKAQHMRLGKTRAIKVLARHLLDNQEAVERFRLEVENSGRLEHPNIVQALDAGEENDVHFLVMEFVEGWNLAKLVEVGDRLPVDAACELIRQASIGLQHAHDHFLVHRDIKPSNLMLNHDGLIKILDLGLARFIAEQQPASRLTMSRGPMGTCDYMAPEQWSDASSVDIRADIYSLGCTLYYVLTGRPPFGGENYKSLVQKQLGHQHAPVPSVVDARTDVPNELQDVIERMMAKAPEDRYWEPAEVIEDIEPFAGSDSVASFLSSLPEAEISRERATDAHISSSVGDTQNSARRRAARRRAARPWYRHPASLVTTALLFAAAFALVTVSLLRRDTAPQPNLASEQLIRDVAMLPGLNGGWWFDEMPWYTPATRTAVARALHNQDVHAVLQDVDGYLDSDVPQVQIWVRNAIERCEGSLSSRQKRLFRGLIDVSSKNLEDEKLKEWLNKSYEDFIQQSDSPLAAWSADDLYTKALLEHKLAELSNDSEMADRALMSYDAALAEYRQSDGPRFTLALLCQTDSARLCFSVLSDHKSAFDRFADVVKQDAPVLFKIEALAVYGHACRTAGQYELSDDRFAEAMNLLDVAGKTSSLGGDHPLHAHVCERHAWSLMDRWNVQDAREQFTIARNARGTNQRRNILASIYVFHNRHGLAMTERYLGNVARAWDQYDMVIDDIEKEISSIEAELGKTQAPPDGLGRQQYRQRYLRNLRERLTNSKERQADCVLYQGAASDPDSVDLNRASTLYQEAIDPADDSSAKVVHACKRCIALALMGEVTTARQEFDEEVKARTIIGMGSTRVRVITDLTEAILTLKEKGAAGGHDALRQFLRHFGLDPYNDDQLRRETLELQFLCAELLLSSEMKSPETHDQALKDLALLENLLERFGNRLGQYSAVDDMLPFLRRFYDLAIAVVGETDPYRSAQLIMASRGRDHGWVTGNAEGDEKIVRVLFHLHEQDGLAVVLPPDGANAAIKLHELGRGHVKPSGNGSTSARSATLPDPCVNSLKNTGKGATQSNAFGLTSSAGPRARSARWP